MEFLIKVTQGCLAALLLVAVALTVTIMIAAVYFLLSILSHLIGILFIP